MKKILLFITLFFSMFLPTYGADTAFDSPTYDLVSSLYPNNGLTTQFFNSTLSTANQFCLDMGGSLSSYVSGNITSQNTASYNGSIYDWLWSSSHLQTVICDIGGTSTGTTTGTGTESGGTTFYFGGLSIDGETSQSGALHVMTVNQGRIYIEHDNFLFVFMSLIVVAFMYRTIIFIFLGSINFGKNLAQGYNPRMK